jgi:non-homologous end joining protein Ku
MAARAIWKGVIRIGTLSVPVKLYSAIQDRKVHFRLLHKTDHQPVKRTPGTRSSTRRCARPIRSPAGAW